MLSLEDKIEKEACIIQTTYDDPTDLPKGYLDGQLWAFDLVLMWMRKRKIEE